MHGSMKEARTYTVTLEESKAAEQCEVFQKKHSLGSDPSAANQAELLEAREVAYLSPARVCEFCCAVECQLLEVYDAGELLKDLQ